MCRSSSARANQTWRVFCGVLRLTRCPFNICKFSVDTQELGMHFTLSRNESYAALRAGNYSYLRLFHFDHNPQVSLASWVLCSRSTPHCGDVGQSDVRNQWVCGCRLAKCGHRAVIWEPSGLFGHVLLLWGGLVRSVSRAYGVRYPAGSHRECVRRDNDRKLAGIRRCLLPLHAPIASFCLAS